MAYMKAGHGRKWLIKKLAFVMRYGHQQISELKKLTLNDLDEIAEELAEILEGERSSFESQLADPD